ncbi:MAG TPA: GGDEF domain-containing protein [Gammaproteobacteria bacterium]|nr:GGDEF domain-containing protein [Gammaproteobacteria bacterium]
MKQQVFKGLFLLLLLLPSLAPWVANAEGNPEPLNTNRNYDTIGRHGMLYVEQADTPLELAQARQAFANGRFQAITDDVPTFGLRQVAVWLKIDISNPTSENALRRFSVEAPWVDYIDAYLLYPGEEPVHLQAGDARPFSVRQLPQRQAIFEHDFRPGTTELYLRLESPEPVVAPLFFGDVNYMQARHIAQTYGYGMLYGLVSGLLLFNLLIYFTIRQQRYLFYVLYLAIYLLMNISYTGHGYRFLWPDMLRWQDWAPATTLFLYPSSGILFALSFLEMKSLFPRLWRYTLVLVAALCLMQALMILLDARALSTKAALMYTITSFLLTFYYGILCYSKGHRDALYYLIATFATLVGGSVSVLSVAAVIPYNGLTFHAAEIAVALDAILLSIALAEQIRRAQNEKQQAIKLARTDILTRLNNRLAFDEISEQIWRNARQNKQEICFIMLDIDHFKEINDRYGHAAGDTVLKTISSTLRQIVRKNDLLVRWGGEEFAAILPQTSLQQASVLAERIRKAIEKLQIETETGEIIRTTVSLGVARKTESITSIEELFALADSNLYQAKQAGRNRVVASA